MIIRHLNTLLFCALFFSGYFLFSVNSAQAATYYIDYAGGNDTNTGLSTGAAWKHVPGDANATSNALAKEKTLSPGDTIIFKGGVTYYGKFHNYVGGEAGSPITYDGNTAGTWGTGRAILSGGAVFAPVGATWSATTQSELRGNPNYSHIYSIAVPDTTTYLSSVFEDGKFLWVSQNPNPGTAPSYDFFNYDKVSYFQTIPKGSTNIVQTLTSLMDKTNFTSADSTFYNGSYILAWRNPNVTTIKAITAYNPSTKTITYNQIENNLYTDRDSGYAIYNHPAYIDTPGEYYLDEANHRFYIWPLNSDNPNSHTYTIGGGTAIAGKGSYVDIEGFKMIEYAQGVGFPYTSSVNVTNVNVSDNELRNFRSDGLAMISVTGEDILIENNLISDGQRSIGILSGAYGSNITVRDNTVNNTSREGIWFMDVTDSKIDNNLVTNINGTHSNGISVYSSNDARVTSDVAVSNNRIYDTTSALTFETAGNILIYNNIVDGPTNSWGGMRGYMRLFNNTFAGGLGLCLAGCRANDTFTDIQVKNNIINGASGGNWVTDSGISQAVHENNLYTATSYSQTARYNWAFGPGEIDASVAGKSVVFVNETGNNFNLKSTSQAINAGANLSSYFTKDILGNSRPASSVWDLGAYEYDLGGAPADTTAPIITTFTLPTTSETLSVPISTFATYDAVGATGYRVSESATTPTVNSTGWTNTAPTTYTFSSASTKTLYAWAKDAAGNISAVSDDSVVITLPTQETNPITPIDTNNSDNQSSSHRGGGGGGSSSSKPKVVAPKATTVTAPALVVTTPLPVLTGPFAIGMTSVQVKVLQQYLSQDPIIYPTKIVDGYYSPTVTEAVIRFQTKYGINTVGGTGGLAGPVTRAKLNEVFGFSASARTALIAQIKQQILELQAQLLQLLIAQKTGN